MREDQILNPIFRTRFHDKQNRPTHGIAVANHTSPIDSMVLSTDNCYDMVIF